MRYRRGHPRKRKVSTRSSVVFLLCLTTAMTSLAQTFTTVAEFDGANGASPCYTPLVVGADGNFYGTTADGGLNGLGTIFKMSPGGTLTTLHSFDGTDGSYPFSGLVQAGNMIFYGTTNGGGSNNYGTVFKVTSEGTFTTLHTFDSGDGGYPYAGLLQATNGNFYGTTEVGGANGFGTIFEITSSGTLTTLYSFNVSDGAYPYALIQANNGNLYGTTNAGGTSNFGTIFELTLGGTLTTLHSFTGPDGYNPASLIQATDGNIYGTTDGGGVNGFGTIFDITPGGALTTLYTFDLTDGATPVAALIQATDGNFYGTTNQGGDSGMACSVGCGTIFEITPGGTLTTLHNFDPTDGGKINGGLLQATDGNIYGTTAGGGESNDGTVFRLSLAASTNLPTIANVESSASFQGGVVAGSWITIFGTNLSSVTEYWGSAIVDGNLPTLLDGVAVSVGDQYAYIEYISPTQINAVAPNVGLGTVSVAVTNPSGTSPTVTTDAQIVQPAFFQWGNYAVATHQDYSLAVKNGVISGVTTVPAAPGEAIVLWGTGFGLTNPSEPVGVEVPSGTTYYAVYPVTVTVGSTPATVYSTALSPGFAGLYQVAIQIPMSLANGDYPVVATVLNAQSPSTTLITVQK